MTKKALLKDISFEKWNKIRITNPWGKYENPNSLIRKIADSSVLIKEGEGKKGLYFTQSGWDKFVIFIYPENLDEWGKVGTESPPRAPDYNVYVDKYGRKDKIGDWTENLNDVSKMLEEFITAEKKDETINKEIYDFMVKIMGNQEIEYEFIKEEPVQEGSVKNILLIGRTGGGKSTLGNVLVNKNDKFEAVFKESARSVSETKDYRVETLKVGNDTYRIIDTIGIGDTSLSEEDTLFELGKVAQELKLGINQIFFVGKGRFTKEEIEAFGLLGLVLFDKEVENYSSIVRTSFPDFRELDACEEDIEDLKNDNLELRKVIESVKERVIHTDTPPRRYLENPDPKYNHIRENWKDSNKKLWNFLGIKRDLKYLPQNLKDLNERIKEHIENKKEEKNRLQKKIEDLQSQINVSKDKTDNIKGQLEAEKKEHEAAKKLQEKLESLQKELADMKKQAVVDAMKEHERSFFADLRNNYRESIVQGANELDKILPFGGKIVGAIVGGTVGLIGGAASFLGYMWRGKG